MAGYNRSLGERAETACAGVNSEGEISKNVHPKDYSRQVLGRIYDEYTKKTFTRPFYVSAAHLMGREGIMFPGCPSVCACVRARVAAFADRLLVLNVVINTIFFTVLQRCTRGCGGCLPLNQAQSLID